LNLTQEGQEPYTVPGGEVWRYIEDGDEVIFSGYCERDGYRRIGLGECRGIIISQSFGKRPFTGE